MTNTFAAHNRRRTLLWVAATTVVVVIAAALVLAVHRGPARTESLRTPVITRTQDIPDLPLNRYSTTVAQNTTMRAALRLGARVCMAKYGFPDFHGADLYEGLTWTLRPSARDFLMINADDAAKHGYHVTPPSWLGGNDDTPHGAGRNPVIPPDKPNSNDSDLANAIYNGDNAGTLINGVPVPPGGCNMSAVHAINTYVPDAAADTVSSQIDSPAIMKALDDQRVKAAVGAWSRCMARAGFTYRRPWDPYNVAGYWSAPTVTPAEIADATANVRCKAQTNLVGIWWAATAEFEQRILQANPGYFAAVADYTTAMLARCSQIVAPGRPTGDVLTLTPPTMPTSISDLFTPAHAD